MKAPRCQLKVVRVAGGGKKVRARMGRGTSKKCELSGSTVKRLMKKHGSATALKEHVIQMHVERSRRMMSLNKSRRVNKLRSAYKEKKYRMGKAYK